MVVGERLRGADDAALALGDGVYNTVYTNSIPPPAVSPRASRGVRYAPPR